MNEFDFIRSIKQNTYTQPSLIKGIGDDATVFRQPYKDIITAVDTFVENVHFSRKTMKPFHIGYRVLAANISDMAAMGCDPVFYLISIVIPKRWSEHDLQEIYQGLDAIAKEYKIDLIGGDTVSGEQLVISVTIIGYVDKDKARYRSVAADNDIVFVTGTLGDSAAGFHLLQNDQKDQSPYLVNRHRMPTPRVAFAKELANIRRVALNDVSDGIGNEAAEIAEASNVTIFIQDKEVPIHPDLHRFSKVDQKRWKLFGGEDFELIGTVPPKDWQSVIKAANKTNTTVTQIGYVKHDATKNKSVFLEENGTFKRLGKAGYTHLK